MNKVAVQKNVAKIALIGNPNAGKSSVFNQLTGLQQKVGNFTGVTVDKKTGFSQLDKNTKASLIDLPGTYSLYPNSADEKIVLDILLDKNNKDFPELILYILDASQIERHCLLLTQLIDLKFKVVVAINMIDVAKKNHIKIDSKQFEKTFGVPAIPINARSGDNFDLLKKTLAEQLNTPADLKIFYPIENEILNEIRAVIPNEDTYRSWLIFQHSKQVHFISTEQRLDLNNLKTKHQFNSITEQFDEILDRYNAFTPDLPKIIQRQLNSSNTFTDKLDNILTHKFWGVLIFFALMLLVFQAMFNWSTIPMDFIDAQFTRMAGNIANNMPDNLLTRLLTEGIIPGIGGIVIFVPQIFLLFLIISILEEVGYMSRAVYLFDSLMQRFGLNGRSIVALISGGACAIPAIMSTRTISNPKERLITILITPFISCSARIPIYALLIAFVVPSTVVFGFLNLQALVFMGMYLLGVVAALGSAYILHKILKTTDTSFLSLDLPEYKIPYWKNVMMEVNNKVQAFVFGAGKVIIVISIVLWFAASFGPNLANKKIQFAQEAAQMNLSEQESSEYIASKTLENSYAGIAGRVIEPVIKPIGFDWKIGIAIITSFAAREVFIGTMSTLYSIGEDAGESTIREKLGKQINPETKQKVFTVATSLSLLVFYAFALQCMSTMAVVYRETKTWKYPIYQFIGMGLFAYIASFIVYHLFK